MKDDIPGHIISVKVTGEVRYDRELKTGEHQLGISFTRVDDMALQAIGRFLDSKGA
jgi:hypothetical protein